MEWNRLNALSNKYTKIEEWQFCSVGNRTIPNIFDEVISWLSQLTIIVLYRQRARLLVILFIFFIIMKISWGNVTPNIEMLECEKPPFWIIQFDRQVHKNNINSPYQDIWASKYHNKIDVSLFSRIKWNCSQYTMSMSSHWAASLFRALPIIRCRWWICSRRTKPSDPLSCSNKLMLTNSYTIFYLTNNAMSFSSETGHPNELAEKKKKRTQNRKIWNLSLFRRVHCASQQCPTILARLHPKISHTHTMAIVHFRTFRQCHRFIPAI